jgi:hypothetical protein
VDKIRRKIPAHDESFQLLTPFSKGTKGLILSISLGLANFKRPRRPERDAFPMA